jgi:integrating conjugative element, PFGI_1 class, parB family protein
MSSDNRPAVRQQDMKPIGQPRKPQLSVETALAGLLVPAPAQTNMDIAPKDDVFPGLFMNVSVNEIDFFDKNPRTRHDPEQYGQIKQSIREAGVQQPVHITRRPGDNRFVLAQGGNTRLKIVRELYAETGDERFAVIPAIFAEYTSEADIQIAHLIENEQRAEMCFWDKAQAYAAIRGMFQAESAKKLSLRELAELFLTHGLSLTHNTLSLMFFAADHLNDLGMFAQYLSNQKTFDIRKLYYQFQDSLKAADIAAQLDGFWSSNLSAWAVEQTEAGTQEPDISDLSRYLQRRFAEAFGDVLPQQGQEPEAATDSSDIGLPETDGHTGQSPATAAGTVRLPENSRQAASAATSTLTDAPATVAPPLDAAAKRYDGAQSAAAALAYADRDAALQALHQAVRSLLSAVGLNDCFRTHAAFPYAFYLEYPDFRNLPQTNPHAIFAIDHLHAEAGNVFVFLCRVSGQDRLMSDLSLGEANPILGLPEHSTVLSAYRDADVWDEYATMGIGERAYLLDSVLEWQTADTPYSAPVAAILAAMRAVRTFDAGGGHD